MSTEEWTVSYLLRDLIEQLVGTLTEEDEEDRPEEIEKISEELWRIQALRRWMMCRRPWAWTSGGGL